LIMSLVSVGVVVGLTRRSRRSSGGQDIEPGKSQFRRVSAPTKGVAA
jgi:hypothetical protein